MTRPTIRLGPFDIRGRIGEGGMGTVYRAVHAQTGFDVAVKLIRNPDSQRGVDRFRREVQAHARLVHPNVVYLFEYGTVDREAARAGGGRFRVGSPYVAMEFADGGTLRDHAPPTDWPGLRSLIVQALEGLAFSHARDVVHRDLKPENLLIFEGDDGPRLKLSDFGIAHAVHSAPSLGGGSLQSRAGTPSYMAPEQVWGWWREYGPWSDLYSLGCIAWELVSGRKPFEADTNIGLFFKHLEAPPPPLEPRFAVPESLEAWVRRAMAKDPHQRFRRAADALRELPGADAPITGPESRSPDPARPGGSGESDAAAAPDSERSQERRFSEIPSAQSFSTPGETAAARPALHLEEATRVGGQTVSTVSRQFRKQTPAERARRRHESRPAPSWEDIDIEVPASWRTSTDAKVPPALVGLGLGLFGLRGIPFVGRTRERDAIWEALRTVNREEAPRVMLVVGNSGSGKSGLVDWIATRAHEVGAASTMRAVHTASGEGPGEGLAGMVRRALAGWDIGRSDFFEHLLSTLPGLDGDGSRRLVDASALTEFVFPDETRRVEPRFRFVGREQKFALLNRLVRRMGQGRPTIVTLDDAHWSRATLSFADYLVGEAMDPAKALVLVTLREEALLEDPELADRVEQFAERPRVQTVEIEALAGADHRALIEKMLPLEPPLVDQLARRTEGNPLFATQLVEACVERERFVVGAEGFRLGEGQELELPDNIHQLWTQRLETLIAERYPASEVAAWRAIELAAALGREVRTEEWRKVVEGEECEGEEHASREVPAGLSANLIERGLAERTEEGWSFTHGMLVDSIRRRARERGRWRSHHASCARMLDGHSMVRCAYHWEEAGELDRAVEALAAETERLRRTGDLGEHGEVLRRQGRLLEQLGAAPEDRRVLENRIEMLGVDIFSGVDPSVCLEALALVRRRAEKAGFRTLVSRSLQKSVVAYEKLGQFKPARESAQRAVKLVDEDSEEQKVALIQLARAQFLSGKLERAREVFERVREVARETEDLYTELRAVRGLSAIADTLGDTPRAKELLRERLRRSREAGFRWLEGDCLNGLGEIARFAGDAQRALGYYRRHVAICRELNLLQMELVGRFNIVVTQAMLGRYELAAELLERCEERVEAHGWDVFAQVLELARLNIAAGTSAWSSFDRLLEDVRAGGTEGTPLQKDDAWLLEMAADLADKGGQLERATAAWALAREYWTRLGNPEAVDRLTGKIEGG